MRGKRVEEGFRAEFSLGCDNRDKSLALPADRIG